MRYIKKETIPYYFSEEIASLEKALDKSETKRREIFDSLRCKTDLHQYILESEQNTLCAYCEAKIRDKNKSHIEHIEPMKRDKNLVFDYSNLIVSCNGVCFNDENKRLTCGHKKDTKGHHPNYDLFLKPTKVENMREYFIYTPKGFIGSSHLDKKSSNETLRVLNLNDPNNKLPEERLKALKILKESIKSHRIKTGKDIQTIIKFLLNKENLAFISFLRFQYRKFL